MFIDEDTDEKKVWQIVGEPEADAKKGKISITSPLARALMGKTKGANVEVVTPGGARAYEVKRSSGADLAASLRPIGQIVGSRSCWGRRHGLFPPVCGWIVPISVTWA